MFKNLKSPAPLKTLDLKTIMIFLDLMNGNILYLTHELDQIKKIVMEMRNTQNLQKQVDEYFDDHETSPQTDSETKWRSAQ